MNDLRLLRGYRRIDAAATPPRLSFRRMLQLALRTWPFMRPMLKHLILMGVLGLGFGVVAATLGTVYYDVFTNKMLVGQKLQPLQATFLLLDDEYVSSDPVAASKTLKGQSVDGKGASEAADIDPELTPDERRTVRSRLLVWFVIGGVLAAVGGSAIWYYSTWVWQSINQDLRVAMLGRAESLSLRYHATTRVGDAIFRVYQDSAQIINLLQAGIINPITIVYGILVGIAFVAAFDPWFALMVVIVSIPVGWILVSTTARIRRRALANRLANSDLTSRVQEVFAAIKIVKASRAEGLVCARFEDDSKQALDAAYYLRLDMALLTTAVAIIGGAMVVLSEYVMVTWVIEDRETFLGAAVVALIGFAVWNLGAMRFARGRVEALHWNARGLLGAWMRMQDLFIALERAFHLLDVEPEVADPDEPVPFPGTLNTVEWRRVTFAYDEGPNVLRDIELAARAGTVTAIVGATGSGKSTLMALLLRLYDPSDGTVSVNGIDLRSFAVDDVRRHVAIALQKNVLFADTVANNIAFASGGAGRAPIENSARLACADEFIQSLPNGYDTELGERGGKLSSGQRQRLAIARAVVRDTPILILDEPTASLDARTEQQVLANLADWGRDRVIFLITHRLSTIRSADQIAFMADGCIVERGNHDELMARADGGYRAFVEAETSGVIAGDSGG